MKLSNYTVCFNDVQRDEIIWFNTFNGALAYSSTGFDVENNLALLEPAGFALTNPDQQTAFLAEAFYLDQKDAGRLSLCIAPSYVCNLACPYCYEQPDNTPTNAKPMSQQTQDAIIDFVQDYYQQLPFSALEVLWYGGEPILMLDLIESLSSRLIEFTQSKQLSYQAKMTSNATLIDQNIAARLAAIDVGFLMPTLDGIGSNHDKRRPAKNSESTYQQVFEALFQLSKQGIKVGCNLNMDRKNFDDYIQLRETLAPYPGIDIFASQLRDYNGKFASGDYSKANFDPYKSRSEYAAVLFDLYSMLQPNQTSLCQSLHPVRMFCQGQLKNYFVIDALGDIFACDGYMGQKSRCIATVFDHLDVEVLRAATTYSPFTDPLCKDCAFLPQCKGECGWERGMFDENCHPLKYTMNLYVQAYRDSFPNQGQSFEQLVKPLEESDILANSKSLLLWNGDEA